MILSIRRLALLFGILLVLVAVAALAVGAADLAGTWGAILSPFDQRESQVGQIIWQIRAPRIATAILIGAALGVAGALAQGSTNNVLAEPAILGTAAGASLGVLTGLMLNVISIGSIGAIAFATAGALLVTLLVFRLSLSNGKRSTFQLIIVGIATSALISAIVGLSISITSRPDARSISFWSLGSFTLVQPEDLIHLAPIIVLGVIGAYFIAPPLDLLSLGDSTTHNLGFNPQAIRLRAFIILSVLVAAAVSTVGVISFVGLAAPHIARLLTGPVHRRLVISSALIGALILLISDTVARSLVPPIELPISLITSLIGAPILIYLVRSRRQVWQ